MTPLRPFPENPGGFPRPSDHPTREQSRSPGMASSSRGESGNAEPPRHSRSVGIRRRSPGTGKKKSPGKGSGIWDTAGAGARHTGRDTRTGHTGTTRRKRHQEHRAGHARWEIPGGNSPALPIPWNPTTSPNPMDFPFQPEDPSFSRDPSLGSPCSSGKDSRSSGRTEGNPWIPIFPLWGIGMEQDPRSSLLSVSWNFCSRGGAWEPHPPPWGITDGSRCIHGCIRALLGSGWECSIPFPGSSPPFLESLPPFLGSFSTSCGSSHLSSCLSQFSWGPSHLSWDPFPSFLGSFPSFWGFFSTFPGILSHLSWDPFPPFLGLISNFLGISPTLPGVSPTLPGILS